MDIQENLATVFDPQLERDLSVLHDCDKIDRKRGEVKWREEIVALEQQGKLPLLHPGSLPDWNDTFHIIVPDWGNTIRHCEFTHHLGVIIEQFDEVSLRDLATLAQGTVTTEMLNLAMTTPQKKRQFIKVLLQTMERNGVFVPEHTTITQMLKSFRYGRVDFKEALDECLVEDNLYSLHLMRHDATWGFKCDDAPTIVEHGMCQGCRDLMPAEAKCVHVTNSTPRRQHDDCAT